MPCLAPASRRSSCARRQSKASRRGTPRRATPGGSLRVSAPTDALERDADRVADGMFGPSSDVTGRRIAEGAAVHIAGTEPGAPAIQREASAGGNTTGGVLGGAFASRVNAAQARGGEPLSPTMRSLFEPRLGLDLGNVRVHRNQEASELARGAGARAFTVGADVFFGRGEYQPGTRDGNRLIAHEMAHVSQQAVAGVQLQRACAEGEGPPGPEPPIPGEEGPHPLVYRGTSALRSRRPAVGDAQQLLNRFLDDLENDKAACKPGADMAKIQAIRATLNQDPLDVDCRFGPNTEKVTRMFQRCVFPLEPGAWDGKIGKRTWPELDLLRASPSPAPGPSPTPAPTVATCVPATNPDRFARSFNPTTASETGNAISHPIEAVTAYSLSTDALSRASTSGLAGLHLGPADAFRHCFWNCRMTQELGSAAAERFGTAHENSNPSPIPHDNDMDLHNNFIGRDRGTPGADCDAQCRAVVASGELRTVRRPPAVAAACMGASSQPWP